MDVTDPVDVKPDLKLPVPDPDRLSPVERYLVAERRIRPDRIKRLIQSGDLYADHHANAVFVLRSADNAPVGAELRGSGPRPWRGYGTRLTKGPRLLLSP